MQKNVNNLAMIESKKKNSTAQGPRGRGKYLLSVICWLVAVSILVSVAVMPLHYSFNPSNCSVQRASTEIFEGITYGCERLEPSEEGSGFVHWVRIDLTAPGIELYVTPMDPTAVSQGWQYRLRRVGDVVDREHLAVAINATLFTSNSSWRPRMSGDLANGVETVVADHVVSHVWEHTYLLWFDDRVDAAPAAVEAANGGRARNGEVGHRRTRRLAAGW